MKTVSYIRKITDRVLEYLDELGFAEALAKRVAAEIKASSPAPVSRPASYGQPRPPVDFDDLAGQVSNMMAIAPDRYLTASNVSRALAANFNDVKVVLERMADDGKLNTTPGRRGGIRYWLKGRGPRNKPSAKTPLRDAVAVAIKSRGFEDSIALANALEKRRFVKADVITEVNRLAAQGEIRSRTQGGETFLEFVTKKGEVSE